MRRATGLPAVVIPHYDNAEGGHHDPRFCYLGERRLSTMEQELPDDALILGVDEHTGAEFDLGARLVTVTGRGGLTVRRHGHSAVYPTGSIVSFDTLAGVAPSAAPTPAPRPAAAQAGTGGAPPAPAARGGGGVRARAAPPGGGGGGGGAGGRPPGARGRGWRAMTRGDHGEGTARRRRLPPLPPLDLTSAGRPGHASFFARLASSVAMNSSVVSHGASREMSSARSLVI